MRFVSSIFVLAAAVTLVLVSGVQAKKDTFVKRRQHARFARNEQSDHTLQKRGFNGQATFYEINPGDQGACGDMLNANDYIVALNSGQYGDLNSKSSFCGKTITISAFGKSAKARIVDACPEGENCHHGALDMSKALFQHFTDLGAGVFDMTWSVDGEGSGNNNINGGDDAKAKQAADDAAKKKAADDAAKKKAADDAAKKKAADDAAWKKQQDDKKKAELQKQVDDKKKADQKAADDKKAADAKWAAEQKQNEEANAAEAQRKKQAQEDKDKEAEAGKKQADAIALSSQRVEEEKANENISSLKDIFKELKHIVNDAQPQNTNQ